MGAAPATEADENAAPEDDKATAQGMIAYDISIIFDSSFGKTAEGKEIVKLFPTVIKPVHEGTHVLWRKNHPFKKGSKANREQSIADELHAQENQLLMYKYLKDKKGCHDDAELELRLPRQANGELRKAIEERFVTP
jgi:hypothetical protein